MVTGKQPISSAVRVLVPIALAAELGTAPVLAELELVLEVAVLELAAESLAIGQAAARARVIVLGVELVLVIVQAKVALLIALAEVGEPETVQVEAVPELDRVAVPLRIKSVTGPRRHDQVLLLTVEDLAVEVVETTRERAVTEAVIAWEVAE
jgi:hypothetical protein